MRLADVNILVNAYRPESEQHEECRASLDRMVRGDEAYAVADSVITGAVRVLTNGRVYKEPTALREALSFAAVVRNQDHAVVVSPGRRHWEIFERLCREADARGKLVPDTYLAALAIEHGCEFVTCDKDFARFPGLRWRHPDRSLN
jgi:toxin-antitoxin system PIN domain toxin